MKQAVVLYCFRSRIPALSDLPEIRLTSPHLSINFLKEQQKAGTRPIIWLFWFPELFRPIQLPPVQPAKAEWAAWQPAFLSNRMDRNWGPLFVPAERLAGSNKAGGTQRSGRRLVPTGRSAQSVRDRTQLYTTSLCYPDSVPPERNPRCACQMKSFPYF